MYIYNYICNFCITYQLHVSAISNLVVIRLDTIIRETIYYNVIQYNHQCQCKHWGTRSRLQQVWRGMCATGNNVQTNILSYLCMITQCLPFLSAVSIGCRWLEGVGRSCSAGLLAVPVCTDTWTEFLPNQIKIQKVREKHHFVFTYEFHVTYIHETHLLYSIIRRYSVPYLTNTVLKK